MRLTEEQKHVLKEVVRLPKEEVTIGGRAGTGKTTLIRHLVGLLPRFAVCAYTGKAANVLRSKGVDAKTIHSLIYKAYTDEDKKVHFSLAGDIECEGVIVDEASMVSRSIYEDLRSFGKPLIFVGDHGQLEPVGDDFNLMREPDYRLEEIHRNAGEIAHFAEYVRQGYRASSWGVRNGPSDKIRFVPRGRHMDVAGEVDQVICAYNKTRAEVNRAVRVSLGRGPGPETGDRIICLKNNSVSGLFNGMQGVVESVHPGNFMAFESDGWVYEVEYDPDVFGQVKYDFEHGKDAPVPLDYAYAATCHKCVHPDTMVETDQGLLPIKDILPTGTISTPDGKRLYKNFVSNPPSSCVRVVCKDGYEITMTEDHKAELWDGSEFVESLAGDLKKGQIVRVKIGSEVDVAEPFKFQPHCQKDVREVRYRIPEEMSDDLAEFLGLMVADGTIFKSGFRLLKRHKDVIDRFKYLCESLFGVKTRLVSIGKTNGYEVSSAFITRWLESLGGMKPNDKDIPDCVLRSPLRMQNKFLRGLFEDGSVNLKHEKLDHIEFVSHFPKLLAKVRSMLLRAGVVSCSCDKKIYIYSEFCEAFRQNIGFVSSFKNQRLEREKPKSRYRIPISHSELKALRGHLSEYDYSNCRAKLFLTRGCAHKVSNLDAIRRKMNYHYVEIKEIESLSCETMCVEVPETHKFHQNGFPFGNCQGSEFHSVLVLEQKCDLWDHRRWAYTAASRARDALLWCES